MKCSLQKWAVLLTITALVAMISGCGSSTAGVGSGGTGSVAVSKLHRDTSPQVSDADLAAVVAGNTTFALNAFPKLDTNADNNTFFSPYSITMAFALLAPGANGNSLAQIEQAMSYPLPQDRLNPAFNKLDLLLASEATGAALPHGLHAPILTQANAVWGQQGAAILPAYLDTLAVNYGAGLHLVDFINDTEGSRKAINNWVAQQTKNKIQNLIPQGGLTSDSRVVLTNAIWFKANWASPFSASNTQKWSFTNRDGSTSLLPFMNQKFFVPYAQADGCQAVDIPYAGNNMSMLVIMPDSGTFDGFMAGLTPSVLTDITNQLTTKDVALSMPKFTYTMMSDMPAILKSLGMTDPFDSVLADLSGIDGLRDLHIMHVYHQAFIGVSEKGTEAAAATGIDTGTGAVPPPPNLTLTIDRPFIFLIRDRQTGLILFMGKVVTLPAS